MMITAVLACGPWQGCQDRVKRVGLHHGFQVSGYVRSLGMQRDQLPGQVGNGQAGRIRADHDHRLFLHRINDGPGPGGVPAGSVLLELGIDPSFAGMLQRCWGGPGCKVFQYGVVFQPGPKARSSGG